MSYTVNFRDQILEAVSDNKDSIDNNTVFIIKNSKIRNYSSQDPRDIDSVYQNKLLLWDNYSHLLNYQTDPGYGGLDCHEIIIWTSKFIYFIHEYDGSHSIDSVPRNPTISV